MLSATAPFFIIILKGKRLAFIYPANFLFHGEKGLQKLRTECTALSVPDHFQNPFPGKGILVYPFTAQRVIDIGNRDDLGPN